MAKVVLSEMHLGVTAIVLAAACIGTASISHSQSRSEAVDVTANNIAVMLQLIVGKSKHMPPKKMLACC
jgi:hypothetical protein